MLYILNKQQVSFSPESLKTLKDIFRIFFLIEECESEIVLHFPIKESESEINKITQLKFSNSSNRATK